MDRQTKAELRVRLYSMCSLCADLIDRQQKNSRSKTCDQKISLCMYLSSTGYVADFKDHGEPVILCEPEVHSIDPGGVSGGRQRMKFRLPS